MGAPMQNAAASAISGSPATSIEQREGREFLGLRFDPLAPHEILERVVDRAPLARFAYVVTPNVDHVVRLSQGAPEVTRAYRDAWLCVNDSRVLERLADAVGVSLPAAPGSDLVADLLDDPRLDRDAPIMVVGGNEELLEGLRARYGLTRLMHHMPEMGMRHKPAVMAQAVAAVEASRARFTLLAVGSPQQELLAAALAENGRAVGVGLCIGAGLEFLVGAKKRAPGFMQRMGLEWAFRLMSEPRRLWRRYLVDGIRIFPIFVAELSRMRARRPEATS
jgi:N-acetylglucosaminyldiphosphoundecaprenol N-acetyl-beta-D-mannosaminyltransferase